MCSKFWHESLKKRGKLENLGLYSNIRKKFKEFEDFGWIFGNVCVTGLIKLSHIIQKAFCILN